MYHYFLVSVALLLIHLRTTAAVERRDRENGRWVTSWTAVPQPVEASTQPPGFYDSGIVFKDATIRQTICTTLGAEYIRFRFSNAFGDGDLPITKVTIALAKAETDQNVTGSSGIHANTLQTLSFGDYNSVIVPAHGLILSDPLEFPSGPNEVFSVSIYIRNGQTSETITTHPISRTDSWMALGDHTETEGLAALDNRHRQGWYFVSAVEAWKPSNFRAFAIVGDSLTEGTRSTMNTETRWPNFLFDRLQKTSGLEDISVINQGAAGNRELTDGSGGANAISRLDRDLFAQSGLGYAMLFEGVNDIAVAAASAEEQEMISDRLIQYYKQSITRIHAFGIPVFGSTLSPFACEYATTKLFTVPAREETRLRINEWIRTSGWFDAVVDFDEVLRDPTNHTQVDPAVDSGDCLHPNDEGYKKMADAFPLELFERFKYGVDRFGPADRAGKGPLQMEGASGIGLSSSKFTSSIATFVLGFISCILSIIALPVGRRLMRTVLRGKKPPRFGPYKHDDFTEEEGSSLELLNGNKFEEHHSR